VRFQRAAGAHVVLVDGDLSAFLTGGGREVVPRLPDEEPARTAAARATGRALARWAAATGRPALGWAASSGPRLAEGPLASALTEAGFVRSGPGFRLEGGPENPQTAAGDDSD